MNEKTKTVKKTNSKFCLNLNNFYINVFQMNSKINNIFYLLF